MSGLGPYPDIPCFEVCDIGHTCGRCLVAIERASISCPATPVPLNPNTRNCATPDLQIGELCESDRECGQRGSWPGDSGWSLNNCPCELDGINWPGGWSCDVYVFVEQCPSPSPPAAPPPSRPPTPPPPAPCTETRGAPYCSTNLQHCGTHFAPGGALSGDCDYSCGFCDGPPPPSFPLPSPPLNQPPPLPSVMPPSPPPRSPPPLPSATPPPPTVPSR